ncbi:MAG: OadG family protein [Eubacterium sp.]|nr:OadG family protein [Eubacterium sp.]
MTKMKKKLLLIVSLCLIAAGVFGCGSDANATYNGYTADQLSANNTGILDELMGMSDEDLLMYQMYQDQMDAATMKVINSWSEVKDEVGDFVGYGEVVVTQANGTTTVEQTAEFTGRDVKVTFVYDKDMNVEDINLDKVYTLGETMTKAAMNTAMGMGTVFVMLIIISLIISCFTLVNKAQKKAEDKKAANTPVPAATAAAPVVAAPQTDDLELVAVIAAAIAAATGSSTDDFVVRSIKRR